MATPPSARDYALGNAQAELGRQLVAAGHVPAGVPVQVDDTGVVREGCPPAMPAAPAVAGVTLGARPRLMGGIIVPAANVAAAPRASVQFVPLRTVASFGVTDRAILAYGRGRPIPLWIGDDQAERDAAFAELLAVVGQALA